MYFICDNNYNDSPSQGSPVRPPPYSSLSASTGSLKPVFLYVISLQVDSINRPVFQVLSQRHTSDFISYFMKYWRHHHNSQKNPNEIVMDNSSALILASVQTFTSFQTKEAYLNACFERIFGHDEPNISCFIRLDRSHIVKEILRMKVIAQQDSRIKKLLHRVLGYLITVTDIKIVEEIIFNIFILISNKYEHSDKVTSAKWAMKTISDHHDINADNVDDEENSDYDNTQENSFETVDSKFKRWINNIVAEVYENFVDDTLNDSIDARRLQEMNLAENVYYVKDENQKLGKCLVNFLSIIPLWGNIMMNSFDSDNSTATSSPTEAEFRTLKHVVFSNEKGIRVDVFIEKYLSYLLGRFKATLAENKNQQKNTKSTEKKLQYSEFSHRGFPRKLEK